jgi:hypothetical protein
VNADAGAAAACRRRIIAPDATGNCACTEQDAESVFMQSDEQITFEILVIENQLQLCPSPSFTSTTRAAKGIVEPATGRRSVRCSRTRRTQLDVLPIRFYRFSSVRFRDVQIPSRAFGRQRVLRFPASRRARESPDSAMRRREVLTADGRPRAYAVNLHLRSSSSSSSRR